MTLRVIAGKYKGRSLKTPKSTTTRPTQGMLREAVFNICQSEIEEASFLDLFAGSGAMGFEAISRGAKKAVLVEQNKQALFCIKENIETLKTGPEVEVFPMDARRAVQVLEKKKELFNIVYIDPPYAVPAKEFLELLPSILAPDALVFVEERNLPKSTAKPHESPSFTLKDSRRFGVALLHQYRFSGR